MKIGIIQTTPLTADFSNNARQIIQGYRGCVDHGADLVIASAYALCGAGAKDLASRTSFLQQAETAIEYLSSELGEVPLIMASYVPMPALLTYEEEMGEEFGSDVVSSQVILVPFLLERDDVTELEDASTIEIDGREIYIDLGDETVYLDDEQPDLIVHLATNSWHSKAAEEYEENKQWEAKTNGVPVVCVHNVGTTDGVMYAGGSAIYTPNSKTHTRMPFFAADFKVANTAAKPTAKALPEPGELLNMALVRGIRDTVLNNKYEGACLSLDNQNSLLMALLCMEALGASKVHGISFEEPSPSFKALGIHIHTVKLGDIAKDISSAMEDLDSGMLEQRIKNAITISYADKHGLMPMTAITRNELMMGEFVLYGDSAGYLAPLGNLYKMDIYMLCQRYQEQMANIFGTLIEPTSPEIDRIIHELADRNISADSLLKDYMSPFKENDVRMVQRRIVSSAFRRTQTPMILRVDREDERTELPSHHRLND